MLPNIQSNHCTYAVLEQWGMDVKYKCNC